MPPPDSLSIFNAQPGATLLLSPDWVILGASDDYLAATLTERAVIVGQYIFDAFPDNPEIPEADGVTNVRASLETVLATRRPHEMAPQHYDVPDPAQPGRFVERHWKPRHTPVLDAHGQVQFIIQSVQDITASRLAERQLRDSQAGERAARADAAQQRTEIRHLLEQAPMAVAVYHGPEFRVEMANATTLAIWGRPLDAVLGRSVFEVLPEAATPEVVALFEYVYRTGNPYTASEQATRIHRHGQLEDVYWNFAFLPQHGPDGRIRGLLTVGTEVTEQVRARQQLQQLNQELETRVQARTQAALALQAELLAAAQQQVQQRDTFYRVFEETPAAICLQRGPDHRYEYVNAAYQAFFPGRAFLGRPVAEALPETVDSGVVALLDRVYRTGETYFGEELPLRVAQPDGELKQRYFTFTYQAYRENGAIVGISTFATDVTQQVLDRRHNKALQAQVLATTQRQVQERGTLYQVFSETPALICILRGPEHRYDYFNAAYQQQFPGRELPGRAVAEALPETVEQGFITLLDRVYQTGETYFGQELELTIEATAGTMARSDYYNLTYQAYREDGQVVGVCVFAYVVTEQVLARRHSEALQADLLVAAQQQADQRALLYQIFEQTPAVVALLRAPAHRYEYVNPAYQALFPGRELLGRDAADTVPEMAAQGYIALLDQVYQTGETYFGHEQPFAAQPAPGHEPRPGYFNFTYQAYRERGEVAGVSVFAFDVTEQVLARQQREAERQQLHALFMEAPAPLVILDGPQLVYQLVNPAYQRIFPGRALLGKPLLDALPELADAPLLLGQLQRVYDTGETLVAQELPLMLARHDGGPLEEIYWTFTYQARRDARGEVDGVLVFAHEVTDQVQARRVVEEGGAQARALAAELAASNQQLTRTNVDLDNFIYTASHDLKAPISNIEGLLYLLQEELPAAVAHDAAVGPTLTRMLDAVERFKRTIDHLTEVSKLQKEHAPATAPVNLAAVIEDVRQDLAPFLHAAGAKLVVDVPALPAIEFSEKNLRSIVYNLLSNAVKYHSPDRPPRVDVRAHVRDGHTVLEVHDNGLGLAPAHVPKLFGMFQRFHDHVEGTGIGLYMIKRMVENSGGRIEVHSQLGAGTTFFVFLPHAASTDGAPFPEFVPS
ncbi:PAS domain-containing protein [Hymenobacter sp. B1770]|uniref:PAS domain-containing protein n=1 Tax=Hymenobacter sp. B1770 TaxID=1718788 RepID=UPI003CF931EC